MAERFEHKDPLALFLHRPSRDVGSMQAIERELWVLDPASGKAEPRLMLYCEALKKIFDEPLQNATVSSRARPSSD